MSAHTQSQTHVSTSGGNRKENFPVIKLSSVWTVVIASIYLALIMYQAEGWNAHFVKQGSANGFHDPKESTHMFI